MTRNTASKKGTILSIKLNKTYPFSFSVRPNLILDPAIIFSTPYQRSQPCSYHNKSN